MTPDGSGYVQSSPYGIDCPLDCGEPFDDGAQVTLSAYPSRGYVFVGWGGACTGTAPCRVTVDRARAVTALFASTALPPPPPPPPPTDTTGSGGGEGTGNGG